MRFLKVLLGGLAAAAGAADRAAVAGGLQLRGRSGEAAADPPPPVPLPNQRGVKADQEELAKYYNGVPPWVRADRRFWTTTTTLAPSHGALARLEHRVANDTRRFLSDARKAWADPQLLEPAADEKKAPTKEGKAAANAAAVSAANATAPTTTHRGHLIPYSGPELGTEEDPDIVPYKGPVPFDGFKKLGCAVDDSPAKLRNERPLSGSRPDLASLTPEVCFDFCRKVAQARFFALSEGRGCYCAPEVKLRPGGWGKEGSCDSTCEGNAKLICGGKGGTVSAYAMYIL